MAARAVVFDLDGTLWDSRPVFAHALSACSGSSEADLRQILDRGENVVRLARVCRASNSVLISGVNEVLSSAILYDGIDRVLAELSARDVALGTYSSLPEWIVRPMLEALRLRRYFRTMVCAGNRTRKPNPEGILRLLRDARLPADDRAFYVGDQPIDADTARRAGVRFAWSAYGYGAGQPSGTSVRIGSPRELLDL